MCCCPAPQRGWLQDHAPRDGDTRQRFRKMLREGELDDREIEIEVRPSPLGVEIMAPPGMEEMTQQLQGMFQSLGGGRTRPRKLKIKDALKLLVDEEASKMINEEELKVRAVENAEQNGIVFIDEIDKIARRQETVGRGRVARRRTARSVAAGRGLHRQHQVRHGQDRSRAVHRLRRLSHVEALGFDPGTAGPSADSRRARAAAWCRISCAY